MLAVTPGKEVDLDNIPPIKCKNVVYHVKRCEEKDNLKFTVKRVLENPMMLFQQTYPMKWKVICDKLLYDEFKTTQLIVVDPLFKDNRTHYIAIPLL